MASPWPTVATFARLLAVPLLFVLWSLTAFGSSPTEAWVWWVSAAVFGLAMATDAVDGWLARRLDGVTVLGRMLDPLVDKVLVLSVFVFLSAMPETQALVPAWVTGLILTREVLITGLRGHAEQQGIDMSASRLGKWKTMSQTAAVLVVLLVMALWGDGRPAGVSWATIGLVQVSVVLALWSGADYVWGLRGALLSGLEALPRADETE